MFFLLVFFNIDWFKLLVALWVIRATWPETDLCTVRPNPGRGKGLLKIFLVGGGGGVGVFGPDLQALTLFQIKIVM